MFCDSSKKAYGSVCYLRIKKDDDIYIQHVISKSKVAPIKGQTIPRLELMAALLGCSVLKNVMQALKIVLDISRVICWSDSQIVFYWISGKGSADGFVKRKLDVIKRDAEKAYSRYCPSKLNPADVITRGTTMRRLVEGRWLDGPSWRRKMEDWHINPVLNDILEK